MTKTIGKLKYRLVFFYRNLPVNGERYQTVMIHCQTWKHTLHPNRKAILLIQLTVETAGKLVFQNRLQLISFQLLIGLFNEFS